MKDMIMALVGVVFLCTGILFIANASNPWLAFIGGCCVGVSWGILWTKASR